MAGGYIGPADIRASRGRRADYVTLLYPELNGFAETWSRVVLSSIAQSPEQRAFKKQKTSEEEQKVLPPSKARKTDIDS